MFKYMKKVSLKKPLVVLRYCASDPIKTFELKEMFLNKKLLKILYRGETLNVETNIQEILVKGIPDILV